MLQRGLNIIVRDSLFDPDRPGEQVARVRRTEGKRPLYRVFIYLDGPDLPFVKKVTYALHQTFSPNTRTVSRSISNPRCKLEIWTWGVFAVRATVLDKQSRTFTMTHALEYASALKDSNIEFQTT